MKESEKKRILVVEDEQMIREGIADVLQLEGFEVLEIENGMEAITKIKSFEPDLVLSDVMMPVMNGYTLLTEYRKLEDTKDIPFIFLTALSERKEMRNGMKLGADDYLTKPFSRKELLDAVHAQLEKFQLRRKKLGEEIEQVVNERLLVAEIEKKSIIRELHHRVKHNLALISAFFDLGEPSKGEGYIESIRNRVFALASVHEEAYSSEILTRVSVSNLVTNITVKLLGDKEVLFTDDLEDYELDIEKAIPFGLLLYEMISVITKTVNSSSSKNGKAPYMILRTFSTSERGVLELITKNMEPVPFDMQASDMDRALLQAYLSQLQGTLNYRVVPDLGVRYKVDFSICDNDKT